MQENDNQMKNDEGFRNQFMQKFNQAWTDADSNKNGKLNLDEFRVFEQAMRTAREANGEWFERDNAEANYNIFNSVSEGDGFTKKECWAILREWKKIFDHLK